MDRQPVDHLLLHIGRLLTMDPSLEAAGPDDPLGPISDGAIAIRDRRIVDVSTSEAIMSRYEAREGCACDLRGQVVLPGFVDPHTHVLFAGTREAEFAMRLEGKSYMEIAAGGGGIVSSVRAFREATDQELYDQTWARLDRMLATGTTTVEAKSGYGLDTDQEIRALRLIDRLEEDHAISLLGTFLGAHEFPVEYRDRRDDYVRLVIEEMLPRVAAETRARFCDVFCEEGVYTAAQARAVLVAAKEHGLPPRLHADEFAPSGASELAAELHALSADHLMEAPEAGLRAMQSAGTVAILLPGTSFSMGNRCYAPARKMIELGLCVALATDCNPGSSMTTSMPLTITLAVLEMKMTLVEALMASTVHAAASLDLVEEAGMLRPGLRADLQVLDASHEAAIAYQLGGLFPARVMKGGEWVAAGGELLPR